MEEHKCRFSGCINEARSVRSGLCGGHYRQKKEGKSLKPLQKKYRSVDGGCSFPGCDRKHYSKGYCVSHNAQIRLGIPLRIIRTDIPTRHRFMSYVLINIQSGCWEWVGRMDRLGYGMFRIEGKNPKAHRFGWERVNGPIPKGMYIDHLCHNRSCVNLEHLRVVTPKKNSENRKGATIRSTTGIRGVSPRDNGTRFVGRVGHHGKIYSAGTFSTEEEAERAVIALREKLYGTD